MDLRPGPEPSASAEHEPRIVSRPLMILACVMTMVSLACIAIWTINVHNTLIDPDFDGRNLDIDFSVFWAAAQLALEGDWTAPFDSQLLNERRLIPVDREAFEMIWFYPPAYLALILPLGTLSFFHAWAVFSAVGLTFFALALHRPARAIPGALALVVLSPASLMLVALGQNSLFFAGLLVLVIEALRRRQHVLAGLLIAAMTLKPQLGLAIPIILLAGGYWRVILWALIGTLALVAVTMIYPGPEYWLLFFDGLLHNGERIRETDLMRLLISTLGNGVHLGLGQETAMTVQIVVSLYAAAVIAWIWRSPTASFDLKAAALCFTVITITPYAVHYELIFAAVGVLYLGRDGAASTVPGRYLMTLLWLMPALGYVLLPWPGFGLVAGTLILTLAFCVIRAGGRMPSAQPARPMECPSRSASH